MPLFFFWHCCVTSVKTFFFFFGVLFLQDFFCLATHTPLCALESQRQGNKVGPMCALFVHLTAAVIPEGGELAEFLLEDKVLQSCEPYWGEGCLQASLPTSLCSGKQHPGEMDYVHVKDAWPEARGQSLNWELNNLLALCVQTAWQVPPTSCSRSSVMRLFITPWLC